MQKFGIIGKIPPSVSREKMIVIIVYVSERQSDREDVCEVHLENISHNAKREQLQKYYLIISLFHPSNESLLVENVIVFLLTPNMEMIHLPCSYLLLMWLKQLSL